MAISSKEILEKKLDFYRKALGSFNRLLHKDLSVLQDLDLLDGVKNGQIQKFEYCAELTWKIIKRFLFVNSGIDARTPKESCKQFYQAGFFDEEKYLQLINMLDDRNNLSHLYSEEDFERIHNKLNGYCTLMLQVLDVTSSLS